MISPRIPLPTGIRNPLSSILTALAAVLPTGLVAKAIKEIEDEVLSLVEGGVGSYLSKGLSFSEAGYNYALALMEPAKDGVISLSITHDGLPIVDARIYARALGLSQATAISQLIEHLVPGAGYELMDLLGKAPYDGGSTTSPTTKPAAPPARPTLSIPSLGDRVKRVEFDGDPEIPCDCDATDPAATPCGHPGCHVNPYKPDHDYEARTKGDPCSKCGLTMARHLALRPEDVAGGSPDDDIIDA